MARTKDAAVTWPGVSAAVALLTSLRGGSGDLRADVTGDLPEAEVLAAMEVLAAAFLNVLAPGGRGDHILELIGLAALEHGTRRPGGPE